jgi:LCP family protein required for cell wall assembly
MSSPDSPSGDDAVSPDQVPEAVSDASNEPSSDTTATSGTDATDDDFGTHPDAEPAPPQAPVAEHPEVAPDGEPDEAGDATAADHPDHLDGAADPDEAGDATAVDHPDEAADPDENVDVAATDDSLIDPVDASLAIAAVDVSADDQLAAGSSLVPMVDVLDEKVKGPKKRHRSWGQRALLGVNCVVILACFAGAVGLLVGRHYGNSLARVDLNDPPPTSTQPGGVPIVDPATGQTVVATVVDNGGTPANTNTVETFPAVDPDAQNFLITGADNNACIDPSSPFYKAFGDRETMGERSDTIMLMRVDPKNRRAAVLSFPRDLWVKIDGRAKSRINSAYVRDDPQKLINTLYGEFGLGVDHFIQVDFCAFKVIVDEVGGVAVPFDYPARDVNTGLFVPEPGCFKFTGEHALAYVRSRHYQYFKDGKWVNDGTSDLGRISRQQDFLRRVLASTLAKGFNPGVAKGIIGAAQDYVVLDEELTIARMLEFAGTLSDFEPGAIAMYQIESEPANIGGNAVLIPRIKGANMQAILNIFRGGAELAGAPEQVFESTTTTSDPNAQPTTTSAGATTVPAAADPDQIIRGIVPPDRDC